VTGDAFARSPLEERSGELAPVGARALPYLAQIDLRVDPANAGRAPYPLPLEPNTALDDGDRSALWLGPDEWLVLGPPQFAREMVQELETAFADLHHSVIDVSANRVAIELTGPDRFDLVSHVCPIDLEPPAWAAGRCAQTLVGRAQVLLHERAEATRLFVRPSFAGYLVDLLIEVRGVIGDMGA
jgi:sarcosine oxidase, subunit gamma